MRNPFFLTAVLALSAISLVGCKKERYYCDETGCYLCDGIGCREVDPPTRPPCVGDFECTIDTICTDVGCADKCSTDADCPEGAWCRDSPAGKICIDPGEPTPNPNPGVCTRNEECDPPDVICVDGMCQRDDSCGGECACSAENPCAEGYTCADGACRPDDEACQFDGECGAGRVCIDGGCYQSCNAMTCAGGFMCSDNICVEIPPPVGECTSNANCGPNEICIDSSCIPTCTVNTDCASGYYCDDGVCRVDDLPHPFCTSNAQCAGNSQCVNGVCRAPCTTSTECEMISGSLPFCHENFCSTFNEANSNCVTSIDCSATDVCVNGLCE
jgi:hypothetical protein